MKNISYIQYDFDISGLMPNIVDTLNDLIDNVDELEQRVKKLEEKK